MSKQDAKKKQESWERQKRQKEAKDGKSLGPDASYADPSTAGSKMPPYIHFTLHKSNRDTADAMQSLARSLKVESKNLTTCGTKDKRGVTVQRVCLQRRRMKLMDVWKAVNGVTNGRKTMKQACEERADYGIRIGDLEYSHKYLELGMLKGNHFVITLR